MVGPDGEEYRNRVVYHEAENPERLAYTYGSLDEPEQFHVTVTFDDRGDGRTDLTMEMCFASAADLDDTVEFGAVDGATGTLERLARFLATSGDGRGI